MGFLHDIEERLFDMSISRPSDGGDGRGERSSDELNESVQEALICCQMMNVTFQSCLDLSGVERGLLRQAPRVARTHAIIEGVVAQVRRVTTHKDIRVLIDVEERLDSLIFVTDPDKVAQVLAKCAPAESGRSRCLLHRQRGRAVPLTELPFDLSLGSFAWNSAKHTSPGPPNCITIRARIEPVAGSGTLADLYFDVEDTG